MAPVSEPLPTASIPEDARLSLEEELRTIGNALEGHEVSRVQLVVDPTGIAVDARGGHGCRQYSWRDVAELSLAQQALRGPEAHPAPWLDPWAMTRWSVLLRLTGLLLAAQGTRFCTIDAAIGATPEESYLRAFRSGREVLDLGVVGAELWRLRLRRGSRPAVPTATVPAPPPRWAFWRRR
jgi:hypothetical protein